MEPQWEGPQTHLDCGCKLYMLRDDVGFEAPEIAFCPTHASAPKLVAKLEAAEKCAAALRMIEVQSEKEALDSDDLLTWMIRIHLWASQALAAWEAANGATPTAQRMLRCGCGRDIAVPHPTPAGIYPCECGARFEVYPFTEESVK